jgi:putative membrane protein
MQRELTFVLALSGALLCAQPPNPQQQQQPPTQRPPTGTADPSLATSDRMAKSDNVMMSKSAEIKFVKDAAIGGLTEVELGKLASQKATSDSVKQFGQKMVDDHSKANEQLKTLASQKKIDVPSSLDSKHQSRVDKLSQLSGAEFDRAYIKDQLKDHQQDVSEFRRESENGSDPDIKKWASDTLPTLEQHLSMVKDLNKNLVSSK